MLDPALFRDNMPRRAYRAPRIAGSIWATSSTHSLRSNAERRRMIPQIEELKREQNAAGEEAGRAKREGRDITANSGGRAVSGHSASRR